MSPVSLQTEPGPSPVALGLRTLGQLVREQRVKCELSILDTADAMDVNAVLLGRLEEGQAIDTELLITLTGLGPRLLVLPTGDAETALCALGLTADGPRIVAQSPIDEPNSGTPLVLEETTPTLFVDFDGTLHAGHALIDESGQITLDTGRPPFEFVRLLVELLDPYPAVEIVLTTSWLKKLPTDKVISYLPPELAHRVVGTTRDIKPRWSYVLNGSDRAYVISSYAYGKRLKHWIAIDDAVYGAYQFGREPGELLEHFLLLDSARGISDAVTQQRIREWLVDVHDDRSF